MWAGLSDGFPEVSSEYSIRGSSNGKTRAFGAWNEGSIPSPRAIFRGCDLFPHFLWEKVADSLLDPGKCSREEPICPFLCKAACRAENDWHGWPSDLKFRDAVGQFGR